MAVVTVPRVNDQPTQPGPAPDSLPADPARPVGQTPVPDSAQLSPDPGTNHGGPQPALGFDAAPSDAAQAGPSFDAAQSDPTLVAAQPDPTLVAAQPGPTPGAPQTGPAAVATPGTAQTGPAADPAPGAAQTGPTTDPTPGAALADPAAAAAQAGPAYGGPPSAAAYQGYPAPPGGAGFPGYPPAPAKGGTNGFAIAALIFGILGGVLLSIIFGIVALVQIRKRGQGGRGLAIAGLVVAGGWALVLASAVTYGIISGATGDGGSGTDSTTAVTRLAPGDCVNDLEESDAIQNLPVVPCTTPHDGEVYAVFDLADGDWPGDAAVQAQAEKRCGDEFDGYTSAPSDGLELFYLHPLQRSWSLDRSVTCIVTDESGPRTGSLRD